MPPAKLVWPQQIYVVVLSCWKRFWQFLVIVGNGHVLSRLEIGQLYYSNFMGKDMYMIVKRIYTPNIRAIDTF
jgi:hypothetical protein